MDDLYSHHKSDKAAGNHPEKHHHKPQPSNSELMSSAKIVAEAAKSGLHDSSKVDKAKVAGATANLLNAANHYGKLEEKGYGKYFDKAENYLHEYSKTTTTTTGSGHSATTTTTTTTHTSSHSSGGGGKSEGGYGDYLKMAEGLLKKR